MPLYIGDYLGDTMHLTTEQHGAYLLLIFHLWRRGTLPDDDTSLAKISGLTPLGWLANRSVLAEFFQIQDGLWTHGRVARERAQSEARRVAAVSRGKRGAASRWDGPADTAPADACSIVHLLDGDSSSSSSSSSPSPAQTKKTCVSAKRVADARHVPFRGALGEYWRQMNPALPEMPWQGRDAKALSDFLRACPHLREAQFRQLLENRARSAVAHGDRVYLWIANLTRFQEAMTLFNKPVSAGGGNASRAEINRDAVTHAVNQAINLARGLGGGARDIGTQPPSFAKPGVLAAYGAGPGGCSVALVGSGYSRVAARDPTHGTASRDGPVPYRKTAEVTGRAAAVGG